MNRLNRLKKYGYRKKKDRKQWSREDRLHLKQLKKEIRELHPRIKDVLLTANKCKLHGIDCSPFISTSMNRNVGIVEISKNGKWTDEYKFVGFRSTGCRSDFHFITNGKVSYDMHGYSERKELPSISHMKKFLQEFSDFEFEFYRYIIEALEKISNCESRFKLIQRGRIHKPIQKYDTLYTFDKNNVNGLIELEYMGSAEFECGAIPNAYRRIFGRYSSYSFHICKNIKNYDGDNFVIFCLKDSALLIEYTLEKYIKDPYPLKERCTILNHVYERNSNNHTNIFWCIDRNDVGNWIGSFDSECIDALAVQLENEYNEYWMKKSRRERKRELEKSFDW